MSAPSKQGKRLRTILPGLLATVLTLPAMAADFAPGSDACRAYAVQRSVELAALELLQSPAVQAAAAAEKARWRKAVGPVSDEMNQLFEPAFAELVFASALGAAAQTLEEPAMIRNVSPPHRMDGREVPGSRFGWDNPDFLYGVIRVNADASYIISGVLPRRDVEINLSAWDPDGTVTFNLSTRDLSIDPSGRFRFTVGKAAGSTLPLSDKTDKLIIRETLADWTRDRPVHLIVEQTGGSKPVARAPAAVIAARSIGPRVDNMIEWRPSLYTSVPANSIRQPSLTNGKQALPNQAYATGNFALADDEALLIQVVLAGASYFTMPVSNIWGTTGDYDRHVSSINSAQAVANPDGTLTLILAARDPGYINWVSTEGLHEGDLTLRWQGPKQAPGTPGGPSVTTRKVKLAELAAAVPAGFKRVGPAERAAEIKARATYPSRMWVPEQPCD